MYILRKGDDIMIIRWHEVVTSRVWVGVEANSRVHLLNGEEKLRTRGILEKNIIMNYFWNHNNIYQLSVVWQRLFLFRLVYDWGVDSSWDHSHDHWCWAGMLPELRCGDLLRCCRRQIVVKQPGDSPAGQLYIQETWSPDSEIIYQSSLTILKLNIPVCCWSEKVETGTQAPDPSSSSWHSQPRSRKLEPASAPPAHWSGAGAWVSEHKAK